MPQCPAKAAKRTEGAYFRQTRPAKLAVDVGNQKDCSNNHVRSYCLQLFLVLTCEREKFFLVDRGKCEERKLIRPVPLQKRRGAAIEPIELLRPGKIASQTGIQFDQTDAPCSMRSLCGFVLLKNQGYKTTRGRGSQRPITLENWVVLAPHPHGIKQSP